LIQSVIDGEKKRGASSGTEVPKERKEGREIHPNGKKRHWVIDRKQVAATLKSSKGKDNTHIQLTRGQPTCEAMASSPAIPEAEGQEHLTESRKVGGKHWPRFIKE